MVNGRKKLRRKDEFTELTLTPEPETSTIVKENEDTRLKFTPSGTTKGVEKPPATPEVEKQPTYKPPRMVSVGGLDVEVPSHVETPEQLAGFKRKLQRPGVRFGELVKRKQATERQQEERIEQLQIEQEPEVTELQPRLSTEFIEKIPLLGASVGTVSAVIADTLGVDMKNLRPEERRTAMETEIEREVFKEGVTANEKMGAFLESIGLAGFAKGFLKLDLETPSGNVETIVNNIRKERRRATKYETWAKQGELDPDTAFRRIEEIEANVLRLEARIKLLAIYSATLRFNSDELNRIETEILNTKEVLLAGKTNALRGAITDPNEMMAFVTLKNLQEAEFAEEF